ncbi:hypothetical protein MJL81_34315, partial [Salmonella enterica subsp. enterica serovar Anatum]|nr:hypothetical protein [Salmonella enterica subsp. enterica serovar Anatum]
VDNVTTRLALNVASEIALQKNIEQIAEEIVPLNQSRWDVFWPEQIAGFEHMYDGNDDYPYYLLNRTDENNGEMPTQPLAY